MALVRRGQDWLLKVRVIPNAKKQSLEGLVEGIDGPMLKIKVTAVPEAGKANAAVLNLLAKKLGLAKSRLRVASGHSQARKQIAISDPTGDYQAALQALLVHKG